MPIDIARPEFMTVYCNGSFQRRQVAYYDTMIDEKIPVLNEDEALIWRGGLSEIVSADFAKQYNTYQSLRGWDKFVYFLRCFFSK